MEITTNEIEDILETGASPEDIKARLKQLFAGTKSYGFSYSENYKPDDNSPSGMSVRGVVTITVEQSSDDTIIYYGPWRCQ